MTDIPQIVEDLYYETVMIPDQVVHSLYAFYYGLRAGFQLSGALREKEFIPSAE